MVIMDRSLYVDMCDKILLNQDWYRKVSVDMIEELGMHYRPIILGAYHQQLIDNKLLDYLDVKWPRTLTFYALPKVHRCADKPPGRPSVSEIGCHTEMVTIFVDSHLSSHVMRVPSYIKPTIDLLRIIKGLTIPLGA